MRIFKVQIAGQIQASGSSNSMFVIGMLVVGQFFTKDECWCYEDWAIGIDRLVEWRPVGAAYIGILPFKSRWIRST